MLNVNFLEFKFLVFFFLVNCVFNLVLLIVKKDVLFKYWNICVD